ncbi:PREDICTED: uncharacterized protein LOC109159886 [Ipomoea nil]|uniref:uncharacterized protein LOC109159886 n=1 Tax=Ipomoea nil TaxID=35883 RepID=UPI000901817E|nr:PREDICTED: uncharacterized protein LOC109159886 [Ipomoea nil]
MAEKYERQLSITNLSIGGLEISHANVAQTAQSSTDETVAAFSHFNNKKNFNTGGGNKTAKCVFCGMTGHTIEKCYKKHGYPPGWIPGYKSKGKQQAAAVSLNSDGIVTTDQIQKLISLLQAQAGEGQASTTAATVSLIPKFNKSDSSNAGKCSDLSCINSCYLRDHGKMTGFAEEEKGLYMLSRPPVNSFCKTQTESIPVSRTTSGACFDLLRLMKSKSETRNQMRDFYKLIQTQFGMPIKTVLSDNGLEFNMESFFAENGTIHQRSCAYTPQQNVIVERKHQHILSVARALRFQANFPLEFWGHCVVHATYLINRLPSAVLEWSTPYHRLHGKDPDLSNLRVLGCLCYAANVSPSRHKMDARSKKCVLIGMPAGVKGYLLYDLINESTLVSRDVIFYENQFPMAEQNDQSIISEEQAYNPSLPNVSIMGHEEMSLQGCDKGTPQFPNTLPDIHSPL